MSQQILILPKTSINFSNLLNELYGISDRLHLNNLSASGDISARTIECDTMTVTGTLQEVLTLQVKDNFITLSYGQATPT